ncbi:TetR/AcrR family transcriptional regulator [Actinoallomurus sp. CA-142502]|uniref:TetR/AcrR family transcriptional regulator n=1 Tax=Actinoallomurus sp. CA-142502 TaxID=3239885 RepID=UPI003D90BB54
MSDPQRADEASDELDPRRVRSRDRLLDAATELLAAGGIDAVTVEAVTRRSKVARTTLYRNFGNSTELLAAAFERLIPQIEPVPDTGSLREQLIELLVRKSVAIEQAPLQWMLFAWLGMSPATPTHAAPETDSPAVHSLRTRVIKHYREPFDKVLESAEARAELGELGELDPTFVVAQLLGPIVFLRLTGLRPATPADCERIVDDFLTAHSPR